MKYSLEGVQGTHIFTHKNPENLFTIVWSSKTGKYFTVDEGKVVDMGWSEYVYTEKDLNHYGWFGKRISTKLENK